jgi:hypothetical protein
MPPGAPPGEAAAPPGLGALDICANTWAPAKLTPAATTAKSTSTLRILELATTGHLSG